MHTIRLFCHRQLCCPGSSTCVAPITLMGCKTPNIMISNFFLFNFKFNSKNGRKKKNVYFKKISLLKIRKRKTNQQTWIMANKKKNYVFILLRNDWHLFMRILTASEKRMLAARAPVDSMEKMKWSLILLRRTRSFRSSCLRTSRLQVSFRGWATRAVLTPSTMSISMTSGEKHFWSFSAFTPWTGARRVISGRRR